MILPAELSLNWVLSAVAVLLYSASALLGQQQGPVAGIAPWRFQCGGGALVRQLMLLHDG